MQLAAEARVTLSPLCDNGLPNVDRETFQTPNTCWRWNLKN